MGVLLLFSTKLVVTIAKGFDLVRQGINLLFTETLRTLKRTFILLESSFLETFYLSLSISGGTLLKQGLRVIFVIVPFAMGAFFV
jgi:hypothetical protein